MRNFTSLVQTPQTAQYQVEKLVIHTGFVSLAALLHTPLKLP